MKNNYSALLNGKIITIDSNDTIAEAVLIAGDRIAAVGTNEEIKELLPANGRTIDLGGRTVIPGIVDSHVHMELTVNSMENGINVHQPGCDTLEEMFTRIKTAAAKTPKGEWLVATASNGFPEKMKDGRFPTKQELDAICPQHPLILTMEAHVSIMNNMATNKLGWTDESKLPHDVTMGRDPQTSEPTGVFVEGWPKLPLAPWSYDKLLSALRVGTIKHYVSKGVTSAHELSYSTNGIRAWQQLKREGDLPLRLRFFLTHPWPVNFNDFQSCGFENGFGDEWLSLGGFKLFTQGIGINANMQPINDLKYTQEELDELVYNMHSAGLQVWTHTVNENGINAGILAYERALERLPRKDARLRLEHGGEQSSFGGMNEEQRKRCDRLGIIEHCTPQFLHIFDNHRTPYRSYINEGRIVPYNSDTTGSQPEATNPWHSIWVLITRKNWKGETQQPEECLTPLQAIRMATLWGAWGGFEEKIKGSIEPGKLADLVVLGDDPLTCDPDALRTMPVELVIVGGKAKHSGPAFKGVL